jgi:hypothetical protein
VIPNPTPHTGATRQARRRAPRSTSGAGAVLLALTLASPGFSQVLELPPRPADAPAGTEIARELRDLELEAREARLLEEVLRGNVPDWLRQLTPVPVTGGPDGRAIPVLIWVTPDYLAVGSDTDFLLTPLTPQAAQRIADRTHTSLPTPRMVDAVWAAATVRLVPEPIPPSPEMTTLPVFEAHHRAVRIQRARHPEPDGSLVAGHKKDVVLSARLEPRTDRVAIYGWHQPDGAPIQPLFTGHTDRWVDYSHGIRLVSREVTIDGVSHDLLDVLREEGLAPLLSGEGVIPEPRYGVAAP